MAFAPRRIQIAGRTVRAQVRADVCAQPRARSRRTMALLLAVALSSGCSAGAPRRTASPPIGIAALKHTPADVHFMRGMIHHHAQAVLIAQWAPSHGASAELQRLCERIVVGQSDEIALMRTWLTDKGEPVPDATDAGPMKMKHDGMEHEMLMPGMLSADDLKRLDAARGNDFDRLFLVYMIRHHEGAITMVEELFGSPGAAQDETVFRFASDVFADQTTEIRVMQQMLDARGGAPQD
ncbi:MAG TPA: DUF305 domain-containing protein [Gemmatimonadaceae bacterium]|nr:DUF305 domain-containing protein [Gemmatimonadaceae bacterium]